MSELHVESHGQIKCTMFQTRVSVEEKKTTRACVGPESRLRAALLMVVFATVYGRCSGHRHFAFEGIQKLLAVAVHHGFAGRP